MLDILADFDYRIFNIFNGLAGKSAVWDGVFIIAAEYVMFLMLAGLAFFVLLKEKERIRWIVALQALAAAFVGRAILVSIIRIFFFRSRPFLSDVVTQLVAHSPLEGSFPSGHATVMFALAFSLFFINFRWALVYFILATLSSLARIVVGVHFPIDILGGMLVAAFSAMLAKWLFDFWLSKRWKKESVRQ